MILQKEDATSGDSSSLRITSGLVRATRGVFAAVARLRSRSLQVAHQNEPRHQRDTGRRLKTCLAVQSECPPASWRRIQGEMAWGHPNTAPCAVPLRSARAPTTARSTRRVPTKNCRTHPRKTSRTLLEKLELSTLLAFVLTLHARTAPPDDMQPAPAPVSVGPNNPRKGGPAASTKCPCQAMLVRCFMSFWTCKSCVLGAVPEQENRAPSCQPTTGNPEASQYLFRESVPQAHPAQGRLSSKQGRNARDQQDRPTKEDDDQ